MNASEFEGLERWFSDFVARHINEEPGDSGALELKKEHSLRVAEIMSALSGYGEVSWSDPLLARAIGLVHDAGRFPQYRRFRTFRDPVSISHGRLGADTLRECRALSSIEAEEREILLSAVRYHGAMSLPGAVGDVPLSYLRMIRDADKIDIWRVMADHYETPADERLGVVVQGVEDNGECSKEVVERLLGGRVVPISLARTISDMRLHQISWVYDINFDASCLITEEAGDLFRIIDGLTGTPGVNEAIEKAWGEVIRRAGHSRSREQRR